jgi:Protein of unknown function (DUF1569)
MDMPERRSLNFSSLEEVVPDVERLLAGCSTVGNWSLGQILHHLATSIRVSRRGRPNPEAMPVSEPFREQFFRTRSFPDGMQAPHPRLVPPPDADAPVQLDELRDATGQWAQAPGPFPDHPLLGSMSKDQWSEFHCIHSAHHLRFAVPRDAF